MVVVGTLLIQSRATGKYGWWRNRDGCGWDYPRVGIDPGDSRDSYGAPW